MKTSVLPVTDITIQFQFNAVWYANEPSITQYFFFNYIGGRFIEREEIKNGEERFIFIFIFPKEKKRKIRLIPIII